MPDEHIFLEANRSCLNCVKSKLCFAYRAVNEVCMQLPCARSRAFTPGTIDDVFIALANSCEQYQKKK